MLPENIRKFAPWLIGSILLITVFTYFPSLGNGFTNWDDPEQVVQNKDIAGLSLSGSHEIFTSFYVGMYQPITMQLYALIYSVFGPSATAFHSISLLLHLLNILLVFLLVKRFVRQEVPALFTAGLFALNPLQTESVAWISATSNLLFTTFYLAGLIVYLGYVRNKRPMMLGITFILFLLSLLSKPAAMTFPVMIFFIDLYFRRRDYLRLILEKLPFVLFSLAIGIVIIFAREEAGHIVDISSRFGWGERVLLICYAIAFYVSKLFIPSGLSAFHPYPQYGLTTAYFLAPLVVLMLAFLMIRLRGQIKRQVWAGIFFFLISLAVVLEFIPLGTQVVKERYVYLPSVGLYFAFSTLMLFLFSVKYRWMPAMLTLGLLVFFMISTIGRAKTWENSQTLWDDVLEKYPEASAPLINRGNSYQQAGDYTRAISDYNMAIVSEPEAADAYMNRGLAYFKLESNDRALEDIDKAISLGLRDAEIHNVRGLLRTKKGDFENAMDDFNEATSLDSTHLNAWINLGLVFANLEDYSSARNALSKALETDSTSAKSYYWRGMVQLHEKRFNEACEDLKTAMKYGWPAEQIPEFCK